MDSEPGRSLILWSVRCAVAAYLAAVWRHRTTDVSQDAARTTFRRLWAAAWLLVVIHVLLAFHFEHHWSFGAALRHTAEMTERVVGLDWAGGLYINFLFLLVWGLDIAGMIRHGRNGSCAAMRFAAAFMMFNATVVFGPGGWIAIAAVYLLALFIVAGRIRRNDDPAALKQDRASETGHPALPVSMRE